MEIDNKKEQVKVPNVAEGLTQLIMDSFSSYQKYTRYTYGTAEEQEELFNRSQTSYMLSRVRGFRKSISCLIELINMTRGMIRHLSEPDYDEIIVLLKFLRWSEQQIIKADRTQTLKDDFIITRQDQNGESISDLTNNFFDLRDEIEEVFEQIQTILLRNKLLTPVVTEEGRRPKNSSIF